MQVPRVREPLAFLHQVGLDYIKVGQQATTLSGGEAQTPAHPLKRQKAT